MGLPFDSNDMAAILRAMGAEGSGLPITKSITPRGARSEAKPYVDGIVADWNSLNVIVKRHEATIQKLWAKKTKHQRLYILLPAWKTVSPAKMAVRHRPDFAAFQTESEAQRRAGTKFADAYLWPYINLDDLTKPRILPLFLNARARTPPSAFAVADMNASHFGITSQAIIPAFLSEHTMYFRGGDFPGQYGKIVSWDKDADAFSDLMAGKGLQPGEGLLILKQQQGVYKFLLECSRQILHDTPAERLTSDDNPEQPEPDLPGEAGIGFASVAILAT
jgi:hypothetical protein